MKEQLKLLEELQRYDARLQEYENGLKALPEKLAAIKADQAKLEAVLERCRQDLADFEKLKREKESAVKDDEAAIAKSRTKLQGVKTGKDYMAAQREVEYARKAIADREQEIVTISDGLELQRKKVATIEADVASVRELVAKEETANAGKQAELTAKVDAEKIERDKAAAKVDPNVMKKYASIRMRRGLAVVPVVGGTCKGCHMKIPPQLYITIQRANSLETCPTCNRIIYWDQIMVEEKMEQAEKDQSS